MDIGAERETLSQGRKGRLHPEGEYRMRDTYYAGCYWVARQEPAEACARRAEDFFRRLSTCEATWNRWHRAGSSFKQARGLENPTDAAAFMKLFAKKENRIAGGFSLWLWAGEHPAETTGVNACCGSEIIHVTSVCLLKPPHRGEVSKRVLTASVLSEVMRAMALSWEPEWGIATSEQHRDTTWEQREVGTFTGWVMYFSRQRGEVPPLPAPVRVEPVEDKGTLVVLTPERFTAGNPEHVALAAQVHELLGQAGLLRPLQPFDSKKQA
jgi:hypothetical protein